MADVTIDERAMNQFLTSPAGPVGQYLAKLAKQVTAQAKARAPIGARDSKYGHPRGYLRSKIGWSLGHDVAGLYADIISPARSSMANPFTPGGKYALWNELPGTAPNHSHLPAWIRDNEGPYLRPALRAVIEAL